MIVGFRHKGLQLLFRDGARRRLRPDLVAKVERVLSRLDAAARIADLDLPGFRLHPLKGDRAGSWSVTVSGNWRIVFRMADGDVSDVDLVDYH